MRLRGSLFWGIILILLAAFLLARQMGIFNDNVFNYFWPAAVIVFGLWLLVGAIPSIKRQESSEHFSIPHENAHSARIKFDHGAGRLSVHGGAGTGEILSGVFGAEMDYRSRLSGDRLEVRLRNSPRFWAWYPGQSLDWEVSLNPDVPLELKVDSGASSSVLDLTDLKVTDLDIDTGASSTEVTLPANAGNTHVDIDTGASSLKIKVPAGVAAHIRLKSGITAINVDTGRFPRLDDGIYQSPDYATAVNRADITVDAGVGSIDIN